MYDVIIRGGRVIDPSQKIDETMDLAVADGKIAALEKEMQVTDAKEMIDAGGRIVTPGLIDLHTHVYEGVSHYGINADKYCLQNGVTTCVDAGSSGADTFTGLKKYVIDKSDTRVLALLNLSVLGMVTEYAGELEDLRYADVQYAVKTIQANRDCIVGLKVRMEPDMLADNGEEVLKRVTEAAEKADCFIMFHIGDTSPSLARVLETARAGDMVTHIFHSRSQGILDDEGNLIPEVLAAAERGVILDVGHGRGSFSYEIAEKALAQGLEPYTISSDLHTHSVGGPVFNLPITMSKFLYLGMPLYDVVEKCTANPARVLGMDDQLGTLKAGACADIAIMELKSESIELTDGGWDKPKVTVTADQYFDVSGVIRGGKVVK